MLPNDAFLRRLPSALDAATYLRLETLVFAADVIESSHSEIIQLLSNKEDDIASISHKDRIRLFRLAWTIIDNINSCRQLLTSLSTDSKDIIYLDFIRTTDVVRKIRNKMDHLNQNIENLAKSSQSKTPLFGALTYLVIPTREINTDENGPQVKGGLIIMITAGTLRKSWSVKPNSPFGKFVRVPVSNLKFQAFDFEIEIDETVTRLSELMSKLNISVEKSIRESINDLVKQGVYSEEELLGHFGEGFVLGIKFKTNEE